MQWAGEEGIRLTTGGIDLTEHWGENRVDKYTTDSDTIKLLIEESTLYMNDIITMTLHGWRYHLPTGANFLDLPDIQLTSNYAHILRREQAYLSNDGKKY